MSVTFDKLWVEKYRPQTLTDMVLSEENRNYFSSLKDDIPHMMFVGPAGVGKTSISRIIVQDILKCQYLYINASDENGIDTIRNKVTNFAQIRSIDGKIKAILLDECLHEDTLVSIIREGVKLQIPIKNLKDRTDLVKTFNVVKDRIEYRPFNLIDKSSQEVYEIEFENNEKIICTIDHKWYVIDPDTDKPVRMKLKDIMSKNITHILTKTDSITIDGQ